MFNTKDFIIELQNTINTFTTCFYENAPDDISEKYAVLSNLDVTKMDPEDLAFFDIDLWNKETLNDKDNAIDIEEWCDNLRNNLNKSIIKVENKFIARIYSEKRQNEKDNDFDLIHRKLIFSAKIYNL